MAVKRRTIWLNDERWDTLQTEAAARGLSPSALIADWLRNLWDYEKAPRKSVPATHNVGRVEAISTESTFTAFRPVPKPGHKS